MLLTELVNLTKESKGRDITVSEQFSAKINFLGPPPPPPTRGARKFTRAENCSLEIKEIVDVEYVRPQHNGLALAKVIHYHSEWQLRIHSKKCVRPQNAYKTKREHTQDTSAIRRKQYIHSGDTKVPAVPKSSGYHSKIKKTLMIAL
jgi:hypothetical protein